MIPELLIATVASLGILSFGLRRLARARREVCLACWKRTLVGDRTLHDYRCEHCGEQFRRRGMRLVRLAEWEADEGPFERIPTAKVVSRPRLPDKR